MKLRSRRPLRRRPPPRAMAVAWKVRGSKLLPVLMAAAAAVVACSSAASPLQEPATNRESERESEGHAREIIIFILMGSL